MMTNDSKDQGRDDMMLPQGRICGDCASFNTCKGLFGCEPGNTRCDFSPSRFMIKIEAALATSASALARDEASLVAEPNTPEKLILRGELVNVGIDESGIGDMELIVGTRGVLLSGLSADETKALAPFLFQQMTLTAASSAATVSDAASVGAECSHRIVDARNEVVKSGYMCIDCGALFTGIHPTATVSDAASVGDQRLETTSENIARDIREGRFPQRSEPQTVSAASSATAPLTSDSDGWQGIPKTPPAEVMEWYGDQFSAPVLLHDGESILPAVARWSFVDDGWVGAQFSDGPSPSDYEWLNEKPMRWMLLSDAGRAQSTNGEQS